MAHRLAWLLKTGSWPPRFIDQIDGNRSNNRWNNLREATKAENGRNGRLRDTNRTRLKGRGRDGVLYNQQQFVRAICLTRHTQAPASQFAPCRSSPPRLSPLFGRHRQPRSDHRRKAALTAGGSGAFPLTSAANLHAPGDLVTQELPGGLPHIVIISDARS
jgi:hypothetical protein